MVSPALSGRAAPNTSMTMPSFGTMVRMPGSEGAAGMGYGQVSSGRDADAAHESDLADGAGSHTVSTDEPVLDRLACEMAGAERLLNHRTAPPRLSWKPSM